MLDKDLKTRGNPPDRINFNNGLLSLPKALQDSCQLGATYV